MDPFSIATISVPSVAIFRWAAYRFRGNPLVALGMQQCKGSLFVGGMPIPAGFDQSLLTIAYSMPCPSFAGTISLGNCAYSRFMYIVYWAP